MRELKDRDDALHKKAVDLNSQESELKKHEVDLRIKEEELSKREYDVSIAMLNTQKSYPSFRRKPAYTSSLRQYEQHLISMKDTLDERDKDLSDREAKINETIEFQILNRISRGSKRASSQLLSHRVFSILNSENALQNPKLYSALKKPIHPVSPILVSCRMRGDGSDGKVYDVSLDECSCPDYQNRKEPCKHMFRLAIQYGLLLHCDDEMIRRELESIEYQRAALNEQASAITKESALLSRNKSLFDDKQRRLLSEQKTWDRIINERSITHPWAARAYSDALYAYDMQVSEMLRTKSTPAVKAADQVAGYAKKLRSLRQLCKEYEYKVCLYENAVPWLKDLSDLSPEELTKISSGTYESNDDEFLTLRNWLTQEEYSSLNDAKKYQIALDRWKTRKKSNWEAGRDFERYVGYLFEQEGYTVKYTGALSGVNDLGRDLIAEKDASVIIIQCKRWNDQRTIHEKHVFQLYGSVVAYLIDHPFCNASGLLASTCPISDTAQKYAEYLNIKLDSSYSSNQVFDYPMIKCNIGNSGEKIYHLPFDQQYDRVIISPEKGECFVTSIAEAEAKGFRRAYRWLPKK